MGGRSEQGTRFVLLQCQQVSKAFPGVQALDHVDLQVQAGTIHALVGENGAGKSTLMKILAGALQPDDGRIVLGGQAVCIRDAREARRLGIAIVYQEFNLVTHLSVSENVYLGRWPRTRLGWIRRRHMNERVGALLKSLGITLAPHHAVASLSVADQQMVEIARALAEDARLLILDEPSAVLTPHELGTLFALLKALRERGVAIIYISHRLDEIFELADRVTVLRDGAHITTADIGDVRREQLITDVVGRPLEDEFPRRVCRIGDPVLQVKHLTVRGCFSKVSFVVGRGEVFGLTGLVGSGRSSLLRALFGDLRASSGQVTVGRTTGPFANPRRAMAAGVAYLPEDRKRSGLLLERSVRENATLADLPAYSRGGLLDFERERYATRTLMADLHIKARDTETRCNTLSGGNQQKLLLARWMGRRHRVVLLDEPTRGIDVGAKYEIYTLINRLALDGVAVVMVSSELPEVIGMADRIGVMHEGRLRGILRNDGRRTTQEQIMTLASGESCHDE